MKKRLLLFLISFLILMFYLEFVLAETTISNCSEIEIEYETYVLNTSIVGSGDYCLFVNTSNIIIDCAGYNITYGNPINETFGIFVSNSTDEEWAPTNITIKNCNFIHNTTSTSGTAIYFKEDSNNLTINNNTFNIENNNSKGIDFLDSSRNISIYNNTFNITGNSNWGILMGDMAQNNFIYENTFIIEGEDDFGIIFTQSSENCSISENAFTFNNTNGDLGRAILIEDDSVGINLTFNNITSTSYEVSPGIDIGSCSTNFNIEGNRINITGNESSGIRINDNSSIGTIYNNIINISGNLNIKVNTGRGGIFLEQGTFEINVSSNTIYTYGINSTAIFVWGNKSLINLNTITTSGIHSRGIELSSESKEMNLTSNNITTTGESSYGIYVISSSNNAEVYNNKINTFGTNSYGIYIDSCSNGNLSYNNLTGTGSYGIYLNDCTNALVYSNTITNAKDYGIYDYLSNASNISTNTVSETSGTETYVYGICSKNATSSYVESNILYGNDEGNGTYCGGFFGLFTNVSFSSNTIYGNLNNSCANPVDILFSQASEEHSVTFNNNIINSSAGNNSYGLVLSTQDGLSTETINGVGNVIRNSDTCIYLEYGTFIFSGATLSNCGNYDVQVISEGRISSPFNSTLKLINVSLDTSKLDVSESCNITLQEYVRGYVNTTTMENLSDATVVLTNNNSNEQQWSKTTTNGYTSYGGATYYFYNFTGGYDYSSMTSTASKTGYTSNSVDFIVNGQTTVNNTLTPSSSPSEEEDDSSSSGSSSISSASFWASSYYVDISNFEGGYSKKLLVRSKITFRINNILHLVGIISLTNFSAVINVSSTPQQATFSVGDIRRFDVTGDDIYDISVNLKSIENNLAEIELKSISENVTAETISEEVQKEIKAKEETIDNSSEIGKKFEEKPFKIQRIIILIVSLLILVISISFAFYYIYNKNKKNKYYKNSVEEEYNKKNKINIKILNTKQKDKNNFKNSNIKQQDKNNFKNSNTKQKDKKNK
jgi:parallel beta-helix repeat protein